MGNQWLSDEAVGSKKEKKRGREEAGRLVMQPSSVVNR